MPSKKHAQDGRGSKRPPEELESASSPVVARVRALCTPKQPYQNRIELLQGTLDLLILQTLQWGSQHGYGITNAIRAHSRELLQVETGSLYPALHRLEKQGLVKADWRQTEANQRAKFYTLTATGKKRLLNERNRWAQMVAAIAGVLDAQGSEG